MLRHSRNIALALALPLFTSLSRPSLAQGDPAAEGARQPRLTKPPKLVTFVEAKYPEEEKAVGRAASVVLQLAIDATGHVTDVQVLESAGPAFDAAAAEAARRFVFEPAEIDGKPAPIRIHYRYEFVFQEELPEGAIFEGVVRTRTGEPLAGVRVELEDGTSAVTDEAGRFRMENVTPGRSRVLLSRDDLKPLQTEEEFERGQKLQAAYEIEIEPEEPEEGEEADDLEIVVVAPKLTKQTVSTSVEASDAKRVAGTQGDVLKIVENLPGVARATAGSGRVVVWGAAPEDTRVYVDGVRVPLLYHFGGFRSVVHSDLVRSVELIPGAYGAAYGRGLGGIVRVEGRDPAADRLRGTVTLDVLDASAAAQGPIGQNHRFAIAARRSHLDKLLEQVADEDVDEFFPIPRYLDAQARYRYEPSSTEWVEVSGLLSADELTRSTQSKNPADRKSETRDLDFQRVSVRYRKTLEDGAVVDVLPWFGHDSSNLTARFGAVPTSLDQQSWIGGLRASWSGRVASSLTASVGLDLEGASTHARRAGSFSTPAREGDARVFGQAPSDQISVDDWKAFVGSAAPFVEADLELFGGSVHLVPGLRLDPYFVSVNRRAPAQPGAADIGVYSADVGVEPRVSARYSPSRRVTFKLAYGRYRQPPLPEDLSAEFGNPLLEPASGEHVLGGGAFELWPGFGVETTVFYTRSNGLAVRNPVSAPLVAEALVGIGEGRSFGAQFLVRRELASGFFGWVAYTLLRSERRDRPGAAYRLFDYDQTHVLTALASYDLGRGFDVGARFRFSSGYPRTPVVGAFYDTRRGLYEPRLGAHNSERLPDFIQLDLRVAKRWSIGDHQIEAYLDVQNVTNRENVEELSYSKDYSQRRPIEGLPVLPVAGLSWSF